MRIQPTEGLNYHHHKWRMKASLWLYKSHKDIQCFPALEPRWEDILVKAAVEAEEGHVLAKENNVGKTLIISSWQWLTTLPLSAWAETKEATDMVLRYETLKIFLK